MKNCFFLEPRTHKIITKAAFANRIIKWLLLTLLLFSASLMAGICGYHYFENMSWLDSLLNAAMILGGMGEIDPLHTTGGKLFAAAYAMYSGVFLVVCGGLLLVPVFHRILHHFHAEE